MTSNLRSKREAGNTSLTWTAVLVPALLAFIGLAVDPGGQMAMKGRAFDVASQAARAGGQQLSTNQALTAAGVNVDTSKAIAAAQNYIAASGFQGGVTVNGPIVTATVTGTYRTKMLGLVGINTMPVSASAQSRAAYVINGSEK